MTATDTPMSNTASLAMALFDKLDRLTAKPNPVALATLLSESLGECELSLDHDDSSTPVPEPDADTEDDERVEEEAQAARTYEHYRDVLAEAYAAVNHVLADAYRNGHLSLAGDATMLMQRLIMCRRDINALVDATDPTDIPFTIPEALR